MLERELDTELFVRNTKKVTLTDDGSIFLEDAKQILKTFEQAKQKLAQARRQPSVLRICHLASATHFFLSDVVNRFHMEYPGVKIRLLRQDAYEIDLFHYRSDIRFFQRSVFCPEGQRISQRFKPFLYLRAFVNIKQSAAFQNLAASLAKYAFNFSRQHIFRHYQTEIDP